MSTDYFSTGLSMDVEWMGNETGIAGEGRGRCGKQWEKQSSPHFRTSPVFQERMGLCCTSQGRPSMISTVEPSRTSKCSDSIWSCPIWSCRGPTLYLTWRRVRGLPVTDWTSYKVSVVEVVSRRWRQRLPEMKLPAEPESRRAETEITVLETISCAQVESGFIFGIEGWMALTMGRGGRRGHASIMCPLAPQYKHRCCVSRLCLSDVVRRFVLVCIGSGGLRTSGGRLGGGAMAVEIPGEHDNMRCEHRMASWMNRSSPWVSS